MFDLNINVDNGHLSFNENGQCFSSAIVAESHQSSLTLMYCLFLVISRRGIAAAEPT